MSDQEYTPKTPHLNPNYYPLPVEEIDSGNNQSPLPRSPRHASTWRMTLMKYAPFCVHLSLTVLVATVCLGALNGRSFNISSRRPQYIEADGSLSRVRSYLPLQSDVVTAISVAATATRVSGGWWAAGYIWRCIFMAMEGGGISLEGLSQAISNRPPAPRHFTRRSHMMIIYTAIIASFSLDYFSAVLTGAFTWEAGHRLVPGTAPIVIPEAFAVLGDLYGIFNETDGVRLVLVDSCASAALAWLDFQQNLSLNITESSTALRRVVRAAQYLPINSTVEDVLVPFFMVDAFDWIQDPDSILTDQQLSLLNSSSEFSPFVVDTMYTGGLLPDISWGPSNTTPTYSHIVSEYRTFAFRTKRAGYSVVPGNSANPCEQDYAVGPGTQVKLKVIYVAGTFAFDCFAFANVTYRAGAGTCHKCKLISPTVVDAQAPILVAAHPYTSMALAFTPIVARDFLNFGYAISPNYERVQDFYIDLTSRAYQAAWSALAYQYPSYSRSTTVEIGLPTLRANVNAWRVYVWVSLHILILVLGLLLMVMQSHYRHPWVEDTTMAIFWLDTRAIIVSDSQDVDPWRRGTEICRKGVIVLDEAGEAIRSVKMKRA